MIHIIQFTVECYFFQFKLCIVVRSLGAWGNLGPNVGPLERERGQKRRAEGGRRAIVARPGLRIAGKWTLMAHSSRGAFEKKSDFGTLVLACRFLMIEA
jgi:hypothetical protein